MKIELVLYVAEIVQQRVEGSKVNAICGENKLCIPSVNNTKRANLLKYNFSAYENHITDNLILRHGQSRVHGHLQSHDLLMGSRRNFLLEDPRDLQTVLSEFLLRTRARTLP